MEHKNKREHLSIYKKIESRSGTSFGKFLDIVYIFLFSLIII